jgi:low temperature requirement protein LtrA
MGFIEISPPQLRTKVTEGKRSATWLELFYDLAFVVAVAVLVERLSHDISWSGAASFLGYFALIWWLWASHTYYADRYDTDDFIYRLLAAGQMVMIVVLASALTTGEANSTTAFAVAYAASRGLLLVMYWRAFRHVEETRPLVRGYLIGFGAAALIWTASALVPDNARYALWALALVVDLATPWVMRDEQARAPLDVSHLPERFGLFTILVLGESIAAVVLGLSHGSWAVAPVVTATLGIGIATALWWMYFDNARGSVVRRDAAVRRTWRPTVWLYTHFLLAASLAAVGAGLEVAVGDAGHGPMPGPDRWLLAGAVAAALASLALIQIASMRTEVRMGIVVSRLLGIPFVLLLGLIASVEPQWIAAGVLGICAAEVVADMSEESEEGAVARD